MNTNSTAPDINNIPAPKPIMVGHCLACNKRWELDTKHTQAAFDGMAARCPFCKSFQIKELLQVGTHKPELSVPGAFPVEPVSEIKIVRKSKVEFNYNIKRILLFGFDCDRDFSTDTAFAAFYLLGAQIRYTRWLERADEPSLVSRFDQYLSKQKTEGPVDDDEE